MEIKSINYLFCTLLTYLSFFVIPHAIAIDNQVIEYGIVIIPEKKCSDIARALNKTIAHNLQKLDNVVNHWHITLYHGAYQEKDIAKIKQALMKLDNNNKLNLKFTNFSATSDRWIDWDIEKTAELQKLHEAVVKIASVYHVRPLNRAKDVYNDVNDDKKKQIDTYGVAGVMELYHPHMTLFYVYPANSSIQKIPDIIKNKQYENTICKADKIIIGKLGYNGNITDIVSTIPLNN